MWTLNSSSFFLKPFPSNLCSVTWHIILLKEAIGEYKEVYLVSNNILVGGRCQINVYVSGHNNLALVKVARVFTPAHFSRIQHIDYESQMFANWSNISQTLTCAVVIK